MTEIDMNLPDNTARFERVREALKELLPRLARASRDRGRDRDVDSKEHLEAVLDIAANKLTRAALGE